MDHTFLILVLLTALLAPAYAQDGTVMTFTTSGTLRVLEKDFAPGYVVRAAGAAFVESRRFVVVR